jgi:NADH-quinone oxidoreductase subunit N
MSAPLIWILIPALVGGFLLPVRNQRLLALVGGSLCVFLSLIAILLPVDEVVTVQAFSFKLIPSFQILGRSFTLVNSDRGWLALLFGAAAFWFLASSAINVAHRLVPLGLVITSLLVSSLAVDPFLYAALLIEMAVLLSVPLLAPPGQKPGKGILRFLIYQTMAMPFLLISGWLLTGIAANPGNLDLVVFSAVILGLGFALLLGIFPFYTWIPLLAEETQPYIAGFILWSFPTVGMFFGLDFLDRYAWLRETPGLTMILVIVGIIMVIFAGILALFQRRLSRMFGYAVMLEIGFSLINVGVSGTPMDAYFLLFIPRVLGMGVWSLALSNLHSQYSSLLLEEVAGAGRKWSLTSLGLVLAGFSIAGLPLLASFPARFIVWSSLAAWNLHYVFWVFIGSFCFFASISRALVSLVTAPKNTPWGMYESMPLRILIILACLALVIAGIFPSIITSVWQNIPPLFTHLGQ